MSTVTVTPAAARAARVIDRSFASTKNAAIRKRSARPWTSRAAWIPLIAVALVVAAWIVLHVTGHRALVVMSGSMEPVLGTGDLAVVEVVAPAEADPGEIVTFRDPTRSRLLVTHRVVEVRRVGRWFAFVTKGDRNTGVEEWTVDADGTIGRLILSVPGAGRTLTWLDRPPVRAALLASALVVLGVVGLRFIWRW